MGNGGAPLCAVPIHRFGRSAVTGPKSGHDKPHSPSRNKVTIMVVVDQKGHIHQKYPWDLIEAPGGWRHPCGCLIWRAKEGKPVCKHLSQNMRAAVTPTESGTGGGEGCRTDRKQAEGELRTPEANHHALTFLDVYGVTNTPVVSANRADGYFGVDRAELMAPYYWYRKLRNRHLRALAERKKSNSGGP